MNGVLHLKALLDPSLALCFPGVNKHPTCYPMIFSFVQSQTIQFIEQRWITVEEVSVYQQDGVSDKPERIEDQLIFIFRNHLLVITSIRKIILDLFRDCSFIYMGLPTGLYLVKVTPALKSVTLGAALAAQNTWRTVTTHMVLIPSIQPTQ